MNRESIRAALLGAILLAGPAVAAESAIDSRVFGTTEDGREVLQFTLRNEAGMEADITNWGGIVTRLTAPDREGRYENVVLGFDTLAPYLGAHPYFGALIGRYGNRIGGARFTLDGTTYELAANNGPNHLHGGGNGFDKVLWQARPEVTADGPRLRLDYRSADGEEGYPGNLEVSVRYTLTHANELLVEYRATTDAPTPVNLTHHGYFNLSGEVRRDILGHELQIEADRFTPVDAGLIPTGELREVAGTPFDFRAPHPIGARIGADDEQIRFGPGYDHNFVLRGGAKGTEVVAARLSDPVSGRVMTVTTTEPGLQFYSGNFLDGSLSSRGVTFVKHSGLCLETQHFPDSPNQAGFPDTILRPGEQYRTRTRYAFGVAAQ